jgi:hypothetical protein
MICDIVRAGSASARAAREKVWQRDPQRLDKSENGLDEKKTPAGRSRRKRLHSGGGGKNSFHVVGLDQRGAIVLPAKVVTRPDRSAACRNAAVPDRHGSLCRRPSPEPQAASARSRCATDACKIRAGVSKGQKNDFRDAEAIAEAVQRSTMKFVATKTAHQLDLQALRWVRERLVRQRTGIINQIRAFLLERGIAVRQGLRLLQTGHGLPSRVRRQHVRCTPDSCRLDAPPKSAEPGQQPRFGYRERSHGSQG